MIIDRNIVLKRVGNRIYLPTTKSLEWEAPDNLPNKPFLMCRITAHNEESGALGLKLLPDLVNEDKYQIAIEVNSEKLLSYNIKKLFFVGLPPKASTQLIPSINNDYYLNGGDDVLPELIKRRNLLKQEVEVPKEKIKEKKISNHNIELPVKDLKFEDGKVSFECYIPLVARKVNFEIENFFVKKEHDSIKNYFSKVLEAKKFSIHMHVECFDGQLISKSANSPQVDKINDSLFELVEELYIEDNFLHSVVDEIYSLKEKAIESSKETGLENMQDVSWLLNKLITKARTKHYYHLRYLSDKHMAELFNLRLTGKPLSFIFLLANQPNYCLVWETFSTEEATYVWKCNNMNRSELETTVKGHVERIKWLRKNNKMAYLKDKPENFKRIEHDYSGEDFGFKKWKAQLQEFLTT